MDIRCFKIEQSQEKVTLPKEVVLKILEELLEKEPENTDLAILYLAIRENKSPNEVAREIEKETAYLESSKVMKERLMAGLASKREFTWEDVKARLSL